MAPTPRRAIYEKRKQSKAKKEEERNEEMAELYRNPTQVKLYASYRPNYPTELFDFVASKAPGKLLAWDVGTGCGQSAVSLSEIFDSVVATDCSPEQISHAPTHVSNIRFVITPPSLSMAELHRLVAPPGSVDLITVATALHWFDIPAFFEQAKAVLRSPGGVLAVWCYDIRVIVNDGGRVGEIYAGLVDRMREYITKDVRVMLEEGYAGLEFPFEGVDGMGQDTGPFKTFAVEKEMSLDGLIAFIKTAASYQRAKASGVEVLTDKVVEELRAAWGGDGMDLKRVKFPLSLRIGRMK